jgi:two-component system chemotaxis response regulator CheY
MSVDITELRVLLVDDNAQALKLLKMVLSGLGIHQLFTAKDGKSAQDFLGEAEEEVDLIICDWEMPRMTGLELLQQVRSVRPDMPFMMVTGHAEAEFVKSAKEFGVNAYLSKPFTPGQMDEKIRALASRLRRAAA